MKKSITGVVALLAGAFVAHSQGTVSFANYLTSTYVYVSLKSGSTVTPIGGATGGPGPTPGADVGNGNQWTVALYGAAVGSPVIPLDQENGTPVTATLAGGAAGSDVVAGTWSTTAYGVVPGTTGNGSATVQVYAWYNDGGTVTSYAAAQGLGYPVGFGPTGTATGLGGPNPTGGPTLTPTSLPWGVGAGQTSGNFNVTSSIPEPSTIALGVMGASAFLLRLRKKQ
jgi:hypothetical protein